MKRTDVAAVRGAWQTASRELGVRVITSGCQLEDTQGHRHQLVAVVPDFGGEKGMAVLEEWDSSLAQLAASQGFGYTVLAASYEDYERALFEDTLNDWQWAGEGQPPPWYTGAPWTD
jgi:hypothetical protein